MATIIRMPGIAAGDDTARIADWLVTVGEEVSVGQPIVEIETEKASVEFEAESEGRLVGILCEAGAIAEVNAPIGVLAAKGQTKEEALAEAGIGAETLIQGPSSDEGMEEERADDIPQESTQTASVGRVFASPIVRKLVRERGLELETLAGSGPGGRIVRRDLESISEGTNNQPEAERAPTLIPEVDFSSLQITEIPHTRMRQAIARRLLESKTTVPHFYLVAECRVDELLALRQEMNQIEGVRVSVNDFVLKAVAGAFQEIPEANAIWRDHAIQRFNTVDLGLAVSVPSGLVTPVLRGVERMSIGQLSDESRDLARQAREGNLKQRDLEGGTFSVSNLGMCGTREFSAIINPPHSGILAVGAAERRPFVSETGLLEVATLMTVTLSADHRVVDGALAAQWLTAFKRRTENPVSMLV